MTHVHIEAARQHRVGFAKWCLAQDPRIETASATGSDVPVDLYPSVPVELLEGAYVDGFLYNRPDAPGDPVEAPEAPTAAVDDVPLGLRGIPVPAKRPRRQTARKAGD